MIRLPDPTAVCRKSFIFSSLLIRKVLVLTFWVVFLQRVYPQDRRSYYLFFYYLFFYYLYMFPEWSKNRGAMFPEWSKIGFANVPRMVVENSPDHITLWK